MNSRKELSSIDRPVFLDLERLRDYAIASMENQTHPPERPTAYRFAVLTYLCLLTFILYLDRVCIGQAGPAIQREMGLTEKELGYVYASFTLAYGLFMAAAGRLGDRFGSRGVLVAIVLWWSAFTALTGACTGFLMLIVVRFIFGAGEAGALPNCARILNRWFPAESRGLPQGLLNTAALVGGAIAPFAAARCMDLLDRELAPFFIEHFGAAPVGWRWTFVLFGILGLIWAAFFWLVFRDDPAIHPKVNDAEREYIARGREKEGPSGPQPPVPWKIVLSSRNVWLLGLIVSCASFASYLYMFWFPAYLQKGRGIEKVQSGDYASLVLMGGALGSVVSGLLSDKVTRLTGGKKRSRSYIGSTALFSASMALLVATHCESTLLFSLIVSLAFFLMMTQIATWWGAVSDISGMHMGTLFGLMNSMGVVGGIGAQVFFGWMADKKSKQGFTGRAQWDPALDYFVMALILGSISWLIVNTNKSAVEK
ncbi:MAG: MFS transporter [Planctomycetes bacterium]|nr:MFS transporter [Planctomycetota bacterium]